MSCCGNVTWWVSSTTPQSHTLFGNLICGSLSFICWNHVWLKEKLPPAASAGKNLHHWLFIVLFLKTERFISCLYSCPPGSGLKPRNKEAPLVYFPSAQLNAAKVMVRVWGSSGCCCRLGAFHPVIFSPDSSQHPSSTLLLALMLSHIVACMQQIFSF